MNAALGLRFAATFFFLAAGFLVAGFLVAFFFAAIDGSPVR
jgi:hypothetical protein